MIVKQRILLGVVTLAVFSGLLFAIYAVAFLPEKPADPGVRACAEIAQLHDPVASGKVHDYSELFALTDDLDLQAAGDRWVQAELNTPSGSFPRTAAWALLAHECKRVGEPG